MIPSVSHDWSEETMEAKGRWFRSLPVEERIAYFCSFGKLIRTLNPQVIERKNRDARPVSGSYRVLELPKG